MWKSPLFILLLAVPMSLCGQHQPADIMFTNGKIWTVNPKAPTAEAVAVAGGRIIGVGSTADVKKHVGSGTQVVDLQGKRMLPGLIDNHTHFMSGGFQLQSVDLRKAKNEARSAIPPDGSLEAIGIMTTGPAPIFRQKSSSTNIHPRRPCS